MEVFLVSSGSLVPVDYIYNRLFRSRSKAENCSTSLAIELEQFLYYAHTHMLSYLNGCTISIYADSIHISSSPLRCPIAS